MTELELAIGFYGFVAVCVLVLAAVVLLALAARKARRDGLR